MGELRCTHGMPTPASCIDCMDEGVGIAPSIPEAPTVEAVFAAKYPGHCRACNLPIHEGQRLARLSDESYVHEGCAP